MPGIVKIGMTRDSVEARLTDLSSPAGIPLPFECFFAAKIQDAARTERTLHQLFSEHRINPRREFFKLDPERVVLAISLGEFKEITPGKSSFAPEEQEALERVKSRRPNINLEAIGIKPGDELRFSRDENIVVTVSQGGKVILNGQLMSLSASALSILKQMGYKTPTASGSEYWMFDGELLDERRKRIETERFLQPNNV